MFSFLKSNIFLKLLSLYSDPHFYKNKFFISTLRFSYIATGRSCSDLPI